MVSPLHDASVSGHGAKMLGLLREFAVATRDVFFFDSSGSELLRDCMSQFGRQWYDH